MGRKNTKKNILKTFLWMVIIGMSSYVGWAVINMYKDIASIHERTNQYQDIILEHISDVSENQKEKIKSINGN